MEQIYKKNGRKKARKRTICLGYVVGLIIISLYFPIKIEAGAITRPCPICRQNNVSYGCEHDTGCRTVSVKKGGFCGACNRQLAEDEYHLYIYNVDRYWFICNSSKCKNRDFLSRKYYYEVDQKPNSHYTNGVKDYGY